MDIVTELDDIPNKKDLAIADKILSVATNMTAFATSPHHTTTTHRDQAVWDAGGP